MSDRKKNWELLREGRIQREAEIKRIKEERERVIEAGGAAGGEVMRSQIRVFSQNSLLSSSPWLKEASGFDPSGSLGSVQQNHKKDERRGEEGEEGGEKGGG